MLLEHLPSVPRESLKELERVSEREREGERELVDSMWSFLAVFVISTIE